MTVDGILENIPRDDAQQRRLRGGWKHVEAISNCDKTPAGEIVRKDRRPKGFYVRVRFSKKNKPRCRDA